MPPSRSAELLPGSATEALAPAVGVRFARRPQVALNRNARENSALAHEFDPLESEAPDEALEQDHG
ncbi:hypothetical protein [Chondromyces apiculatus]|uniref:Uncharacterized protein n=1 Tax=Chondromyces apiculatus DSM 436 TaxID=1192034 RepID=A0A017SY36_9BACT|nr:hypothetical protein [Chondromyces apiculatus]EYF01878.1 Hypothetical protein CAP_7646 [Chondromyces apiculatus DSM 436]